MIRKTLVLTSILVIGGLTFGAVGPATGGVGGGGGSGPRNIWAVQRADGTCARGVGVDDCLKLGPGGFGVVFTRRVRQCTWVATVGFPGGAGVPGPGFVSVTNLKGNAFGVYLSTYDSAGASENLAHHLLVRCP